MRRSLSRRALHDFVAAVRSSNSKLNSPLTWRPFSDAPPFHVHTTESVLPKNNGPESFQSSGGGGSSSYHSKDNDNDNDNRDDNARVLQAALHHVPALGWTEAAMVAGAREMGLSPSIIGIFPRKEAALVEYFMDECLQKLSHEVDARAEELSNLVLQERLSRIIRIRLQMQVPYLSKWPQALSIQANPMNLPTSFKQRALLMDEIWHASGDRSTDLDWYVKRSLLGGIYAATELYMLTDYSAEHRQTWEFLDHRIRDALDCRKTAQEAAQLAAAVGAGIGNTMGAFLRRQ